MRATIPSETYLHSLASSLRSNMSSQDHWASVINDADDETARLILQLQLDDIQEIEASAVASPDSDGHIALSRYRDELHHHRALRSTGTEDNIEARPSLQHFNPPRYLRTPRPSNASPAKNTSMPITSGKLRADIGTAIRTLRC